jgi:antitoxin component YwqK of YwqJK toxin-antitoxin module
VIALLALLVAAAPDPIACPAGAVLRGATPTDCYEVWCEKTDLAGRPVRHGPARTWYDDGALRTEEVFAEGEREGPFLEWHRNGKKAREGQYARSAKVGRWTLWFESGQVEEEASFRDGFQDGPFAAYWPGGKARTLGRHCGGGQCGRWRTFDPDGRELGTVEYGEPAPVR